MIFGNINNLSEFPFLEEQVKECFEYAKTHDLASYEKGSHEIDGDRLFVNIVEYTTTTPEERFWEAHKNYLDVHVMIHGNEQIDLNFIQNMELKDFVETTDPELGTSYALYLEDSDEVKWYDNEEEMRKLYAYETNENLTNKYFMNGKMQYCPAQIMCPPFDRAKLH